MKRRVRALVALAVCGAILLTGCESSREPVSVEQFGETMAERGYTVQVVTDVDDIADLDDARFAVKDGYQIEFFVYSTEDMAQYVYSVNQDKLEAISDGFTTNRSVSMPNYAYYTKSTSSGYYVVSRVENTLLFASVSSDGEGEVKSAVKALGYI